MFPSPGCICLLFQLEEVKVPQMWRRRIQGFRIGSTECVSLCADGREWCYFTSSIWEMWICLQIGVAMLGVWLHCILLRHMNSAFTLKLPVAKTAQQTAFVLAAWWCFNKMICQQCQVTAKTRTLEMQVVWDLDIVLKGFSMSQVKWREVRTECICRQRRWFVGLGSAETAGGYRYLPAMKATETLLETLCG